MLILLSRNSVTNDHGFRDKYYFYRFIQNPYDEMSIMQRYIAQEGFFRFVNESPEEIIKRKKQFCYNLRNEIREFSDAASISPLPTLSHSMALPVQRGSIERKEVDWFITIVLSEEESEEVSLTAAKILVAFAYPGNPLRSLHRQRLFG
jgi:hypothetical protein